MLKEGIYTLKLTPYENVEHRDGERVVIDESKNITKRFTDDETILVIDTFNGTKYIINIYDLKDKYQDVVIDDIRYEILDMDAEIEYEETDEDEEGSKDRQIEKMIHDLQEELEEKD